MNRDLPPLTVRVGEACRLTGLGRTSIYKLIGDGRLRTVKLGRATLIEYTSLEALFREC